MLTTEKLVYFVELKNQTKKWQTHAIKQLEDTIKLFIANCDVKKYKHKKAFACNKKHKPFEIIDNEINKRFFEKYGFRLDLQTDIIII